MSALRNHVAEISRLFKPLAYRHNSFETFRDFLELAALAIANAVDLAQYDAREQRYLEVIKRYSAEEAQAFPQILGALVLALEEEPADVLGAVFMDLGIANEWVGQFFTPQALSDVMSRILVDGNLLQEIERKGFIRMNEPAVGGGSLVIGLCKALMAEKVNYQRALHVTACDVDIRSVHMAYIQLSLLHVPAVIVHGNTLSLEERSRWYTPAHILHGWTWRLSGLSEHTNSNLRPRGGSRREGNSRTKAVPARADAGVQEEISQGVPPNPAHATAAIGRRSPPRGNFQERGVS